MYRFCLALNLSLNLRMKLSSRIVAPVIAAGLCVLALVVLLWWQLTQSTALLKTATERRDAAEAEQAVVTATVTDPIGNPDDRALYYLREGDLHALKGDWSGAEAAYAHSVSEGGGLPALRKLAQAQLQRRNLDGVRRTIRELKKEGAKPEDLLLLESIVHLRSGELVKARSRLEGADDSPQKHYGLALLAIIQGNHNLALAELEQVLTGWEPVLRSYARTLKAAYDEYALFPESPELHRITLVARALAQVQECELALPLLIQVTDQDDDYRDAWIVQGYCEMTTERPEQALLSLEKAYNFDPRKPEIQYFLGRTYLALRRYQDAITFFEYAITNRFEPAAEVRHYIADAALKDGRGELALKQYELLTQELNTTVADYEGYVSTALALGKTQEAYVRALEATERWPESGKAYELLGLGALETEKEAEAKAAFEKAMELDPFLTVAKKKLEEIGD